jgi:hypothetical protein
MSRNHSTTTKGGVKTTQVSVEIPSNQNGQQQKKALSKIATDKLVIEENLKDHKPYGYKWVNNKDPDIYESELNLSNTDGEENNREGQGGSG